MTYTFTLHFRPGTSIKYKLAPNLKLTSQSNSSILSLSDTQCHDLFLLSTLVFDTQRPRRRLVQFLAAPTKPPLECCHSLRSHNPATTAIPMCLCLTTLLSEEVSPQIRKIGIFFQFVPLLFPMHRSNCISNDKHFNGTLLATWIHDPLRPPGSPSLIPHQFIHLCYVSQF